MMQAVNPSGVSVLTAPQPGGFCQDKPYVNMKNRLVKASMAFGSLQIVFGLLAIGLNAASLHRHLIASIYSNALIGHGFWIGIVFVVTGSFGIVGGVRKSRCSVITFNILSIVSACLTVPLLTISAISAVLEYSALCMIYVSSRTVDRNATQFQALTQADAIQAQEQRIVAIMDTLMVVVAVLEAIASICSSIICCIIGPCTCDCDAGCCCPADSNSTEVQAVVTGHKLHSSLQFTTSDMTNRSETSVTFDLKPVGAPKSDQYLQLNPNEGNEYLGYEELEPSDMLTRTHPSSGKKVQPSMQEPRTKPQPLRPKPRT